MLMNLSTQKWDEELLDLFNIPPALLPKIIKFRYLCRRILRQDLLGANIPIHRQFLGDQQSALFGQSCFDIGTAKHLWHRLFYAVQYRGTVQYSKTNCCLSTLVGKRKIKPLMPRRHVFMAGDCSVATDNLGIIQKVAMLKNWLVQLRYRWRHAGSGIYWTWCATLGQ